MELFLAATPKQKGNSKHFVRVRQRGTRVRRPMLVSSAKDKAAENALVQLARAYRPLRPLEGALRLDVTFVMPIPKGWNRKTRAEALAGAVLPTVRPDRGNLLKLVEDALEAAGFYEGDAQICAGDVAKVYGEVPGYRIRLEAIAGAKAAAA